MWPYGFRPNRDWASVNTWNCRLPRCFLSFSFSQTRQPTARRRFPYNICQLMKFDSGINLWGSHQHTTTRGGNSHKILKFWGGKEEYCCLNRMYITGHKFWYLLYLNNNGLWHTRSRNWKAFGNAYLNNLLVIYGLTFPAIIHQQHFNIIEYMAVQIRNSRLADLQTSAFKSLL